MKKGKSGGKFFQGKETFQRMNFLYQAAHVALAESSKCNDLPAYYGNSMVAIARKSVLKMEPNIKRDICKGCGILLQPGLTAKNRIRPGNFICTCLRCGTVKRFPTKKGYKLWIEKDEACLEVLKISNGTELAGNSQHEQGKDLTSFKGSTSAMENKQLIVTHEVANDTQYQNCSEGCN